MKQHIVISIQNTNRFFALGIEYILQDYFLAQECSVCFVPATSEGVIDLVVCAGSTPLRENQQCGRLGTIMIRETIGVAAKQEKPDWIKFITLGHRAQPDTLVGLVQQMFERARPQSFATPWEYVSYRLPLTRRERQVLEKISQELTPSQIAKKLSVNVKTVSTHKLTAMRKLGFRRNSELYHWLRVGGLM